MPMVVILRKSQDSLLPVKATKPVLSCQFYAKSNGGQQGRRKGTEKATAKGESRFTTW